MRFTTGTASLALSALVAVVFGLNVLDQRREIRSLRLELAALKSEIGKPMAPEGSLTLPSNRYLAWEDSPGVNGITMFRAQDGVLQMNREIRMNGSGTGALFGVKNSDPEANGFATDVPGDKLNRFTISVAGRMWWGNGSDGQDTELFRSETNTLQTNASFAAANSIAINGAAPTLYTPSAMLSIENSGFLQLKLQSPGSGAYLAQGINASGAAQISALSTKAPFTAPLKLNPDGGDVQIGGALRLSNAYKSGGDTTATGTVDMEDASGAVVHVLVHR